MKCSTKHCKRESVIVYLGQELCWKHWSRLCDQELRKETKTIIREEIQLTLN